MGCGLVRVEDLCMDVNEEVKDESEAPWLRKQRSGENKQEDGEENGKGVEEGEGEDDDEDEDERNDSDLMEDDFEDVDEEEEQEQEEDEDEDLYR